MSRLLKFGISSEMNLKFSDENPFHPVKVKLLKFLHPYAIFAKTHVTSDTFQCAEIGFEHFSRMDILYSKKKVKLPEVFKG